MKTQTMTNKTEYAPIILDCGGGDDMNRGNQAIRVATNLILKKYIPDMPHMYCSVFRRSNDVFTGRCADPLAVGPHVYEAVKGRHLWPWGFNCVVSEAWRFYPARRSYKYIQNAAALLSIGGDILVTDYGRVALRLLAGSFHKAVTCGTPNILWGTSVGPFPPNTKIEREMKKLLKSIDLILAREPYAIRYLKSLGVTENVHKVTDPAFVLSPDPVHVEGDSTAPNAPGTPRLPKRIDDALRAGAIGVNLSPFCQQVSKYSPASWFAASREILIHLRRNLKEPIILIPHTFTWELPQCNDFKFQSRIYHSLPEDLKKDVLFLDTSLFTYTEIRWVISRLLINVAARTHAAISGYSTFVPTFAISYSMKSRGINEDIFGPDNEKWLAHFSNLTDGQLTSRVKDLLREREQVRDHLEKVIPGFHATSMKAGEYLADLLRRKGKIS
ncbi:MAG: polysaccharide pyruvyl transferase family protein [Planctomycetia bacterium]|nr:polysaccharide pyruvyl transferase family protein [Planctomycetia bacterium]